MEAEGKARAGRVARTSEVLRAHRPSTTITGHCLCGFKVPAWETIEEHRARMICAELFHMKPRDARNPGLSAPHPGGADNLAMHRALGEAPCIGCLRYLDDVMSEGKGARARV